MKLLLSSAFSSSKQASLQAVFTVVLTYPAGVTALANAPVAAAPQAVADNRLTQRHQPTPMMSTYLLAVCIGHIVPHSIITGDCQIELCCCSVPSCHSIPCPCSGFSEPVSHLYEFKFGDLYSKSLIT